jgi:serine/threonine protein phosphatase 1
MMLAADKSDRHFEEWMSWGGGKTLRSYGLSTANDQLNDVPESHWQFINSCRPFYETDSHFFVHANVYPHLSLEEQPRYMLYWDRFNDPPPHESERCMICGHTPQHDGVPRSVGHAICIDTWAHGGGWLTCLDVQSGQYWQANESQQTRNALIEINFYRVKKCGRSACFKIKFSL